MHLLSAPTDRYGVPVFVRAKVARDHHTQVEKALYSVPGGRVGQHVQVRADSRLVKISQHGQLLREHPESARRQEHVRRGPAGAQARLRPARHRVPEAARHRSRGADRELRRPPPGRPPALDPDALCVEDVRNRNSQLAILHGALHAIHNRPRIKCMVYC